MPDDVTGWSASFGWAAGSAISTAPDLARYVEALVDGDLLGPEMQRTRLASIKPGAGLTPGYGLALTKIGPWLGHSGVIPGYNAFVFRDPDAGNTVVALTSLITGVSNAPPVFELAQAVTVALYGQPIPDLPLPGQSPPEVAPAEIVE